MLQGRGERGGGRGEGEGGRGGGGDVDLQKYQTKYDDEVLNSENMADSIARISRTEMQSISSKKIRKPQTHLLRTEPKDHHVCNHRHPHHSFQDSVPCP